MKSDRIIECANCRREFPRSDLDNQRWCRACRARVLDEANRWARIGALAGTSLLLVWIVVAVGPSTRFLVAWMAMVAATYVVLHRIVRRVAFEVIRSRNETATKE